MVFMKLLKKNKIYFQFGGIFITDEISFLNYLVDEGYYFDKKIIENYLLSMKIKPFIILTGNSGTGKTKLSKLFAEFIDDFQVNDEYLTIKVKANFSSWKNIFQIFFQLKNAS